MTDDPKVARLRELARKIAAALFDPTTDRPRAQRLVLTVDKPVPMTLGGWCEVAAVDQILSVLVRSGEAEAAPTVPPRRIWTPCVDCDGSGHLGQARDGRLVACETCGGNEDALGTGWVSRDEPWIPPASVAPQPEVDELTRLRADLDNISHGRWSETQIEAAKWRGHELARQFAVAPQPDGWQPIETAPKNEVVLVHDCGYVGKGLLDEDGRWLDVEMGGLENAYFLPPPTGWMPLPAPPAASETGEAK